MMPEKLEFDDKDLVSNPTMRCPCLFVVDTSGSMSGAPIDELNAGVQKFLRDIREHVRARDAVEIGVITFASKVEEVLSFGSVEDAEIPILQAAGKTRMGEAVQLAIRRLRERREMYKSAGISSYVPWLVLMTDGGPTDDWQAAAAEARRMGEQRKLVIFGVGIGSKCNFNVLAQFCPAGRPPLRLSGYDFKQFFDFVSRSLEAVVVSEDAASGFSVPAFDDRPAEE